MSLQQELDDFRIPFATGERHTAAEVFRRGTQALDESGILSNILRPGDKLPSFALRAASKDGDVVTSDQLLANGPLAVVFYRSASWCPYCQRVLGAIQRELPRIRAAGGSIVAICPEKFSSLGKKKEAGNDDVDDDSQKRNPFDFPLLHDEGLKYGDSLGITFVPDNNTSTLLKKVGIDVEKLTGVDRLPIPATFVADKNGVVTIAHAVTDYTQRFDPRQIADEFERMAMMTNSTNSKCNSNSSSSSCSSDKNDVIIGCCPQMAAVVAERDHWKKEVYRLNTLVSELRAQVDRKE